MKRIMMMVALAAFLVAALSVSALSAFASPASDACADQGGKYVKDGSQATCVLPPEDFTKGNPQSDNAAEPFTKETTNTQTGAGGGGGEKRDSTSTTKNRGGHTV